MLMRVVRQMLPAFGEHHAVDLHLGVRPGHRHVLIHLGEPAPSAPIVHCSRPSRPTCAF